jgi:transcriptional regulator with XRE-family HTH domain
VHPLTKVVGVPVSPKTGDLQLGRKMAARREALGMSRKRLAEVTGLSYPYIAQIETGYRLPSTRHQVVLAKSLGMSLDELFGTEEELPASPARPADGSRRYSVDEAVDVTSEIIESLPPSVRLEALSLLQLRVMQRMTSEAATRP